MAIVQISQITNRLGLNADLPQLAGAELGWSTDTRQLYIGNGTLEQGAPVIGNTEILTEFSDILNLAASYTYQGTAAGYTVQTGPTPGSPVTQSLQSWMDQWASVKDFGAKGDGLTDDTVAINRALFQLYCRQVNPQIRRSLFFPAGVYVISSSILIPPYAMLYGEGINSSIIQMKASNGIGTYVAEITDSFQQTGNNIGSNGAVLPTDICTNSMSFQSLDNTKNIFLVASATNCKFVNTSFIGPGTTSTLTNSSLATAGIKFDSSVVINENILFDGCAFTGTTWGIQTSQPTKGVTINNSFFNILHEGIVLGAYSSIVNGGPTGTRITNNVFDNIYSEGVWFNSVSLNATGYNVFYDVGDSFQGITNPTSAIILIAGNNNVSIGDMFQRADSYSNNYARIQLDDFPSIAITNGSQIQLGSKIVEAGSVVTLLTNQTNATAFIVSSTTGFAITNCKVDYSITCPDTDATVFRTGSMNIAATGSGILNFTDDYTENIALGITLSADQSGANIVIKYTSLSGPALVNQSLMRYSVSYFG
jgi:hypothetical protein